MVIKKGFSLIELLISITIIGILAAIISSSISDSRARSYDSKIKQQLSHFRTAAEIYFAEEGDYSVTSNCGAGMFNEMNAEKGGPGIYIADGNLPSFVTLDCESDGSDYTLKASLYSGNEYWCVDNKGNSRLVSEALDISDSDTVCP